MTPTPTKFCRFELRTTDAEAARAFYANILGHDRAVIWTLHEQARARGAPPHWLGTLGTTDVEGATAAFVDRGAMQLAPMRPTGDGGRTVILRDPGGAVVALATPPPAHAQPRIDVAWHVLHTNDVARATANYQEIFGWRLTDRTELGAHGAFQQFAWDSHGVSVGAIADVAARPGIHPHWLFFFEVDDLQTAIAATRATGGVATDPIVLPSGERLGVCDDPQGAAFALRERRRAA
ncbi:MAG: VOC family protein [Polyangiaceae bacterium]|jgi:predicted enzyme related to lactoylglutathione lyase